MEGEAGTHVFIRRLGALHTFETWPSGTCPQVEGRESSASPGQQVVHEQQSSLCRGIKEAERLRGHRASKYRAVPLQPASNPIDNGLN